MTRAFLTDDVLAGIDTPAVVVDLDRAEDRIAAMAATMRARGVALRPHVKTHKSLAFARRQIDAGAAGHGSVVGYPDAVIERVYDHHGVVAVPAGADRPSIGEIVWIAPNHVCPVVNLVDEYVIAQGGRIVDRWPVDARGRNA